MKMEKKTSAKLVISVIAVCLLCIGLGITIGYFTFEYVHRGEGTIVTKGEK